MSLGTFLIMRHELLLIAAALSVLIAEIFWNPDRIAIYNIGSEKNMFAGKGIQAMTVYNF